MDDFSKEFIIQTYQDAIASFDIEYLDKTLREAGVRIDDPELKALLRELDEFYGIY